MSAQNDAIRRELGFDLVNAERQSRRQTFTQQAIATHAERAANIAKMLHAKWTGEQCGVDPELLKGVVLGAAIHGMVAVHCGVVLTPRDLYLPDSEGGETD